MYGSGRPASNRRHEYKRSQTVSAIPLGRINKINSISETAAGSSFPSENVSRRCSSGPSITQQNSSTSLTSRTSDNRRQSQRQQRQRKTSSTSSSSYAFQEASNSASRKSSDGSLNGVRYHPPLLSSVSYGPRKSSQQSVIAAAAAWATSKRLGRAPSSPSVLFTKVKEKIKEKVVEASSEWPQMAIIIHERRQRAAVEFEARLQQQQRQILQQLPPHQQLLFQQQLLQQQQRRESLRTISSDEIVLSNRQQQQQQISKRRHRAKSDSGQRTHSYDKDNLPVGFIHHKDAIFQTGETTSRPPSCNRSNSSSSNASVALYQQSQQQQHHHHHHKGIFGFKNSSRRRGHLLSRLGGSVDVQTARSQFRRRSISDDVTNQPSQGASGHVGKSTERKVSKCGTGIVCSDDDIRAIVFEHKQRTIPGQQQRKSTQATTTTSTTTASTSTTTASTSATRATTASTTATPASTTATTASTTATTASTSATTTSTTRGILLKQKSIERYSPEPTCSTSTTYKDTASLFHLAKPSSPSDRESESGNSTSRASPVKPRSLNSDCEVDDVCVTINLTESENETSHGIPIGGDLPIDENETIQKQFQSAAAAVAKKQTNENEIETENELPPLKSSVVEIPEVTFDEKGQTWDVYGAEFDPEILGQAIQHHLEKIIEKKFKDDETESKVTRVSPEERQKRNKRARTMTTTMMTTMMMMNDGQNESFKLSLLRRRDSAGRDVNNADSPGDNRYPQDGVCSMYDVSNNNNICRDSSDSSDNASTSDNESPGDNVSYRRRFTNLISRYLCSLVSRRSHAQSVS